MVKLELLPGVIVTYAGCAYVFFYGMPVISHNFLAFFPN